MKMLKQGIIYIVATPIGNLGDITLRALEVLKKVDKIIVEDTRHSQYLFKHYGIHQSLIILHDHNEKEKAVKLLLEVADGATMALISDAGTPLISDPGYHLVQLAKQQGIKVVPIPGPSALVAALSVSGLPTDRFIFEGFLPPKNTARKKRLMERSSELATLVYFESPHRILASLKSLIEVFGENRQAAIARELTKTFETIQSDTLGGLLEWMEGDLNQQKGEFVIVVKGASHEQNDKDTEEAVRILSILRKSLSVKEASKLTAEITGVSKHVLYELALKQS